MYKFREFYIPEYMMKGLERYVKAKVKPGRFLTAVIENNLFEAIGQADDENIHNIPAFIAWFYNEAPSICWGSKKKMREWLKGNRGKG